MYAHFVFDLGEVCIGGIEDELTLLEDLGGSTVMDGGWCEENNAGMRWSLLYQAKKI
jgi:hypothetical protein